MATGIGTGILNFGTGAFEAATDVPGQAAILATDHAEAFFMIDDTVASNPPGNDADNHREAAAEYALSCTIPIAGDKFTVKALARGMPAIRLFGNYKFRYIWGG